ncbi:MAG: helicase-exonuclease AddAB subunit AddB [Lachnospiraceae bacterium]|nr:helicase-exonuclease AddAB subunit AddB [Lachnospiraceae bacterium]
MSLSFVFGASGAGKSTYVCQDLINRSKAEPGGRFFLIVPDQFTMQTQMDLVNMHENKGIMSIDVLSFGRLTHRIFEEVGGADRPMLDDTGKSLIVRRVAGEQADQIPLIGGNLHKTGYVHEVKSALSEFMQYGINADELRKLTEYAKKRGQLHQKLQDLQVIYEGFLSYIKDKFLTTEESLEVLASLLPKSELIKDSVIVFDGFTGFTPVQMRVISQLLQLAKEVIFTVTIDAQEVGRAVSGEQELFALSKKTVQSLLVCARQIGAERGQDVVLTPKKMPRFAKSPMIGHLERHLFRYPVKIWQPDEKGDRSDSADAAEAEAAQSAIRILEAPSQKEEMRQICIEISRLVREKGYCYRDIAVICGDLEAYASSLEQTFWEYNIPVYMDRTRGIVHNPFIEFIKSALQVRLTGYRYEAVFHYLRSGLADFTMEETDRLETYVREMGIQGRKKWENLFVYPSERFLDKIEELEEMNRLRKRLVAQMEPLFLPCRKMKDFAQALYTFIVNSRVQEKIKQYEQSFQAEGDMVRAREYAQIYRLVMDLLDQIVALTGDEQADIETFSKILEAGFEEIKVGTIPQNVDRVMAGDMERTRLKQIKVLFFAGVNDGYIPRASQKGGLISDLDREFLMSSGKELAPTPRQQMYIQRFYLYLNMTKPSDMLWLSYSRLNQEGKSLRPSFLIEQIRKMYPGMPVIHTEKERGWDKIQTLKDGRSIYADWLRSYADGEMEADSRQEQEFMALHQFFMRDSAYRDFGMTLSREAFYAYQATPLGKAVATALYGHTLSGSVSRLEQYASCAYAHFLRYGLQLKEQEEYSFEASDLGNLFHGVLEIFSEKLTENGYTWFDFPKEAGERLVDEAVDSYSAAYHNTILYDTARNAYMIVRIKRILKRTVATMQYQLKKGSFVPEQFEVSFSVLENLDAVSIALSDSEKMRLRGRIDRVDVCRKEDRVYVKVMDYKSGSRDFSLAALYHGLQLQLVVYLSAGLELTARKYPDKQVLPAAMLYYRVQDPLIDLGSENLTEEQIDAQIKKALRPTGVVSADPEAAEGLDEGLTGRSDVIPVERNKNGSFSARSSVLEPEDFKSMTAFANLKIKEAGRKILEGDIALNPYEQGKQNACEWCAYKKVCGFDRKLFGHEMRRLEELDDDEALVRIRKEAADGSEIYG